MSKVVIADVKAIDHLNLYAAREFGLFRKHGLDVTIVEARDLSAARELVVSGQADLFWSCPLVTAGGGRSITDLAAGAIDGAILEEPYASIAETKGFNPLPKANASAMPCRTISARTGILRENPEAIKRLVAAIAETNAIIHKDPTDSRLLAIADSYTATARSVALRSLKKFKFTERIDEKGLATLANELVAAKVILENPRERLFAQEMKGTTWGR